MILLLSFSDKQLVIGAIGQRTAQWFKSAASQDAAFPSLAAAQRKLGLKRPAAVACAMAESKEAAFRASWSSVRTAVAMANGLAFAWGVPAVTVPVSGLESPDQLAAKARQAASGVRSGHWVKASYSGEPNITKPKSAS